MSGDDPTGYTLLDTGDGRRLEAFGERIVDRPAPVATEPRRTPVAWTRAAARYLRAEGWVGQPAALGPWTAGLDGLTLELRLTASGQVGLFPEHLASLPWLRDQVRQHGSSPKVLNLFAYTGLATLALASA